jgi:hypothetical protein
MDSVVVGTLVVVAICVSIAYRALTQDLRYKRRVRRKRPTRIADARHGEQVKLVGRVVGAEQEVEAPLSAQVCVFVHAWMERVAVTSLINGVPVESWVDAGQTHGGCDFLLEDDSGRAVVKLSGDYQPMALLAPSSYADHVDREAGLRGKEAIIRFGDRISVVGTVTRNDMPEGGPFRGSAAGDAAILLSGTRAAPIVLADADPE